MKKILIITLMYFLFATLFTNVVSANFDDVFDDSIDENQIFETKVLPSKMGPKSVIEFISDTEFIVIEGYVVDGYDVDVISNMAKAPSRSFRKTPTALQQIFSGSDLKPPIKSPATWESTEIPTSGLNLASFMSSMSSQTMATFITLTSP